ncbi:MAG TPA: hypothetical protein VI612_00860 [Candidatus Nanoarchaeia archaeon]|nr:hypothetical protein [Candidatus Nanoarchaeia archaeon]
MGEEQVFSYTSPEQLKLLVGLLAESSIRLDVWMRAAVPEEFVGLREELDRYDVYHHPEDKEQQKRLETEVGKLFELAQTARVLPFTSLQDNFYCGGTQIKHKYAFHRAKFKFPWNEAIHPLRILEGWRFYTIGLQEAEKPADIQQVKQTVVNMPTDRYVITNINAGLNPRDYTSDHYYDGTDYDGHLFASNGTITLTGSAAVPERTTKLLEALLKIGVKPERTALPAPR